MFGNLSYLVWMLIFTVPPFVLVWIWKFQTLYRNRQTVLVVTALGILWWIVSEPIVPSWHPWFYTATKILGPHLLGAPIEDLFFSVIVAATIGSAMTVLIERIDRSK